MADRSASRQAGCHRAAEIAAWRRERLVRAGFGERAAAELSRDRVVDFHALLELVDRGCPPDLAVRIVAPLDRQGGSDRP